MNSIISFSLLRFLADLFSLISGLLAAFQSLMYAVRTARLLQGTSAQSGNWKEGKDERRRERTTFISWPIQLSLSSSRGISTRLLSCLENGPPFKEFPQPSRRVGKSTSRRADSLSDVIALCLHNHQLKYLETDRKKLKKQNLFYNQSTKLQKFSVAQGERERERET